MGVTQFFTVNLSGDVLVEDTPPAGAHLLTLSREQAESLCDDLAMALYPGDPRVPEETFDTPLESPQWTPPEPGEPATYQGISLEEAERRLAAQQVSQDRETPPKTSGGSSIGNLPV